MSTKTEYICDQCGVAISLEHDYARVSARIITTSDPRKEYSVEIFSRWQDYSQLHFCRPQHALVFLDNWIGKRQQGLYEQWKAEQDKALPPVSPAYTTDEGTPI